MDPLFILCVVFFIMLLHWYQMPDRVIAPSATSKVIPATTEKGYMKFVYNPNSLELTFKIKGEYAEQQIRECLCEHVLVQYLQRNEYKEDVVTIAGNVYKNCTVLVVPNIDNIIGDAYISALRSLFMQGHDYEYSNN